MFWHFSLHHSSLTVAEGATWKGLREACRMKRRPCGVECVRDQNDCKCATNPEKSRAKERAENSGDEGKIWWIFIPLTIQKYNSTIVNWVMYISLGNTENCNKCISAFVYTFQSKELQTLSYWFLLHWHDERVGTRLACSQLQVNVDIWKLATGTWDI